MAGAHSERPPGRVGPCRRRAGAAIALVCLTAGSVLAVAHPLWPAFAVSAFLAAALLSAWRLWLGILALPVLLPILNFAPWTGWLIVDEFDLLVLAVLAGGYFTVWRGGSDLRHARTQAWLTATAGCLIAWGAAGVSMQDVNSFAGYASPLNALRVGKSLVWTALLLPLLDASRAAVPRPEMLARFFWASLLGSVWVVLAVLWERASYPGLLNVHTPYRAVGLFWEMHHGGAALDVYLVLIAPLLAWAWRRPLPPIGRLLLGAFILAFVYACLTTFSRGVVFTAAGAAIMHGLLHRWQARRRHSSQTARVRPASLSLIALVGVEAFMVFGTDSFMNSRLQETTRDFAGRLAHWEQALGALESPTDWLFGIGLGRFPSPEVQRKLGVVLPGNFAAAGLGDGTRGARLSGPDGLLKGRSPGTFFALSQRIDPVPGVPYRFSMQARSERGGTLLLQVCAAHLLYPSRCSARIMNVEGGEWQERSASFSSRVFGAESSWRAIGHGVFLASVLTPGSTIEISDIRLAAGGGNLLANAGFDEAGGRWFPQSFRYFLPWHIDNFYLELLVETGAVGLAGFLCAVFLVCRRLFRAASAGETFSIELLSSAAGMLVLGSIVSILDMPRVATLAGSFLAWAMVVGFEEQRSTKSF